MEAYSEEPGEGFHQDVMDFEDGYQGQYSENMMGCYICGLIREHALELRNKSNLEVNRNNVQMCCFFNR